MKQIALIGNPNVGKTTLFNELTGLRQITGNYPGVTVAKRTGWTTLPDDVDIVSVIDLPGAYSLSPKTPDEEILYHVLHGQQADTAKPDLLVCVLDASNLERNLFFALQLRDLQQPIIFVLNMWDRAQQQKYLVDIKKLEDHLKAPCIPMTAYNQEGMLELKKTMQSILFGTETKQTSTSTSQKIDIQTQYKEVDRIIHDVVQKPLEKPKNFSDTMDHLLTHPIWGTLCFIGLMALIFQSIFSWANYPMDLISSAIEILSSYVSNILPPGQVNSLVVDGMIAGVGNVIIFIPQIFLLFFFIAALEDFGYMARAAFVLDRIMKTVGLNGRSFLPLLSSFACAIPGIMATRTIREKNDRLTTILVAPLMSCSARLPVYVLMISAFIPSMPLLGGWLDLKGLTLLGLYFLSIIMGLSMAFIFRKTLLKGNQTPFVLELPPYHVPKIKTILHMVWERGQEFVYRAGTIIFAISILMWFLASYPQSSSIANKYNTLRQQTTHQTQLEILSKQESGEKLRYSYAGKLGQAIEPLIKPLGFDWKIGIGLIASFAAREVLVSTLAIVYNIGEDSDETSLDLIHALQNEKKADGTPAYGPLVAFSLMIFFVLACQCMSTVAIVKRETNSWRWPIFMFFYMTALAWVASFLVFQLGSLWGGPFL